MSTDIESTDERPLSTIRQRNFIAHYHELNEEEMNSAIQKCTRTQVKILNCAARGFTGAQIVKHLGIKRRSLAVYLNIPHFHDAYYTIISLGWSASNIRQLAQGHAVEIVDTLSQLATANFDDTTQASRLAVQVKAGSELLSLAGLHPSKNTGSGDQQVINIGQLLVNLSKADGQDTPQWKR
jgi:hypothetical protein|tara:strand:- start:1078 stop:1623 length:546 start_codon:yes stop_codon:yes gene_type:complete